MHITYLPLPYKTKNMGQKDEIILININGADRPGVTAAPTEILAKNNAVILDIGQADSFGIKEPVGEIYNGDIDLIIVPGVVFDREGNRIGYGRGYYDRFLKLYPRVRKISLAYEFQILDRLEVEEHDEKIDVIVTKNNIRRIKKY